MVQYSKPNHQLSAQKNHSLIEQHPLNHAHTNEMTKPKATYHHITNLKKRKGSMVQYSKPNHQLSTQENHSVIEQHPLNHAHTNEMTKPKVTYHHITNLKKRKGSMVQYSKPNHQLSAQENHSLIEQHPIKHAHTNEMTKPKATIPHITKLEKCKGSIVQYSKPNCQFSAKENHSVIEQHPFKRQLSGKFCLTCLIVREQ